MKAPAVPLVVLAGVCASFASDISTSSRVLERAAHTKLVESARQLTNAAGTVLTQTNRYRVFRNGLNRKDDSGQWVECQPVVQVFANSIVCTGNTYRVIIARNLNTDGAVDFESVGENGTLRINVQLAPTVSSISITDPVDLKTTANGHLFVLSQSTRTIKEYDATLSEIRSLTSIGTSGAAPTGLDVDGDGNIYVALSGDHQIAKYKLESGNYVLDDTFDTDGFIGSSGAGDGQFNTPYDVAVSPNGTEIAVSDSGNHRIQRFSSSDGSFLGTFGEEGSDIGQFDTPKGLAYDSTGYLYIVDSGNNRIVLTLSGSVVGLSGTSGTALGQFQGALNLSIGTRGIYVADSGNNRVQAFDPLRDGHGASLTPFSVRLALSSQPDPDITEPKAVAAISDFLAEKLYVADTSGGGRVLKITLPEASFPSDTWSDMKTELITNGDIDEAISYFSRASAEDYRRSFISIGSTSISAAMNKTLIPVVIESDRARYYFEDEDIVDGETLTFPVEFVKENGVWKILEF